MLNNSQNGLLRCAHYSFMPNRLGYCGPDRNKELFDYAVAGEQDGGLQNNLKEFAALYPYLKLIARSNKIADPFDERAVEAYWIGNELLENVKMNKLYEYLIDGQKLKKKLSKKMMEQVVGKLPLGAKPHHSFHVLNIPKRTGHVEVGHSLQTLDNCRVGWGRVADVNVKRKNAPLGAARGLRECRDDTTDDVVETPALPAGRQNVASGGKIWIKTKPLKIFNNQLILGDEIEREVQVEISGKGFVKDLKIGDLVSVHWGWVCEKLSEKQVENLERWTRYHMRLANLHF